MLYIAFTAAAIGGLALAYHLGQSNRPADDAQSKEQDQKKEGLRHMLRLKKPRDPKR